MNNDAKKLIKVGNYVLTGKMLGKGHFATVVEARHTLLNVQVAIKIINLKDINDEYVKNNFRREALIMSKLCHPNVIHLFEILETSRSYYLVTEIGEGGDLCNFIRAQAYGRVDERRAQHFGRQLASAVLHLHSMGIVHRDLKMENILLDRNKEKLKLIDFGLSNICKTNGFLKTHCGSPEYAAPELYISGRRYGPEVDIWSLGVIFYGMVVGRLPFSPCKFEQSQEERRKYLMIETQKGLDYKHQKALQPRSFEFRNLILHMLNPISKKRITIRQLQMHPWIINGPARDYPEKDTNFHEIALLRISRTLRIPMENVISEIKNKPYGPIGGIYNIRKCAYLNNRLQDEEQNYLREQLLPRVNSSQEFVSQNELNDLNVNQRRMEIPASGTNKNNSTLTPGKVVRYLNEKLTQALNIYSRNPRRSRNEDVTKMDILPANSRPKSVPSRKSTRYNCDKMNNQLHDLDAVPKILSDLHPGNARMRQPNRIRSTPTPNRECQKNVSKEWMRMNLQRSVRNQEEPNNIRKSNGDNSKIPCKNVFRRTIHMNQRPQEPDLRNKYY